MNMKCPSLDELKALVASVDDKAGDHIVWIDLDGQVHITQLGEEEYPNQWHARHEGKFKTRLETLGCGNGYLGQAAAKDEKWMGTMLDQLQTGWKRPGHSGYEGD